MYANTIPFLFIFHSVNIDERLMTLYIADGQLTVNVSFNTPNLTTAHVLVIQSQYGKDVWYWDMTPVIATNRYSEFVIEITEPERLAHINAIYNYEVQDTAFNVVESGLLKYITEQGGSNGTTAFISNNENREAATYYRPAY